MKKKLHPLAVRRLARGRTQAELASMIGVDVMTISRWERGLHGPQNDSTIAHLALALALSSRSVRALFEKGGD